jgi:hypothetical protein
MRLRLRALISGCLEADIKPHSRNLYATRNREAISMSYEHPEESQPTSSRQMPDDTRDGTTGSKESTPGQAIVVVHGETVTDQPGKSPSKTPQASENQSSEKPKPPRKKVSEAKVKLQARLPALDDDSSVGVEKNQVVTRDGKPDLAFTGTLLASAASPSAPQGKWQEYRVYETNGGKHVFSKVNRTIYADEQDGHEAEVFDPSPSSMPSQVLRSARDLIHTRPLVWQDAAAEFFGYDPLAKALYRKLSGQFEEHIS